MLLVCGTLYFHTQIVVTTISSTFEHYIAQKPMNSLFWIIQVWGIDWSGYFKDSKPSYMLNWPFIAFLGRKNVNYTR